MGLLFAHDHKFRLIEGVYYSPGGLSDDVLSRYVDLFGNVTVVARVIREKKVDGKYSKIQNPNIRIIERKSLSSREFKSLIASYAHIIARLPSRIGSETVYVSKKLKKDYLVEMVACPWDSYWNHSLKGKIVAPFGYLLNRYQVRFAPYVVYVTEHFLQKRYPTNGKSIGVSDVMLPEQSSENILSKRKEKIISPAKEILLGTAAAINVPYKGQRFIIKALAMMKKQGYTNYKYQLAGSGDPQKLLYYAKKYGVEDQVDFLGAMPHDKMPNWYDSLDIYIQPSFQEGLSRAIVEAMSRATPCIVSDAGGNSELISDEFICKIGFNYVKRFSKKILNLSLDQKSMIKSAEENLEASARYKKSVLDEKRVMFLEKFASAE